VLVRRCGWGPCQPAAPAAPGPLRRAGHLPLLRCAVDGDVREGDRAAPRQARGEEHWKRSGSRTRRGTRSCRNRSESERRNSRSPSRRARSYAIEVTLRDARRVRIGYGATEQVQEGRWEAALELSPLTGRRSTRNRASGPAEAVASVTLGAQPDIRGRGPAAASARRPRQPPRPRGGI